MFRLTKIQVHVLYNRLVADIALHQFREGIKTAKSIYYKEG